MMIKDSQEPTRLPNGDSQGPARSWAGSKLHRTLLLAAIALILLLAFALVPIPGGDDWEVYYGTARRILAGSPIYGIKVTHDYYSNPPWLAALFVPLGLLPFNWSWSVVSVASLAIVALLALRYKAGTFKLALVLLSPPMIYLLLHGQIDALVLGFVLLPSYMWPLGALTKPQVFAGMIFGLRGRQWLYALGVTGLVIVISLIAFGNWPQQLLQQPMPFISATRNLWLGLWPFQVPVGVGLAILGIERREERYLIAASPFFLPYAATSSLLGPWLAVCTGLKSWQSAIVLLVWWGAVALRAFGWA
jgi:hypothetical protein